MPNYPNEPPKNKHDLCRCKHDLPILTSVPQIKDYIVQQQESPPSITQIATVYSYPDAPTPPLSRTLVLAAWIQMKNQDGVIWPPPCTLAVAVPPFMTPQHETNAQAFVAFRQSHVQQKWALLLPDKYGRSGVLQIHSSSSKDDDDDSRTKYAVSLHVIPSWSHIERQSSSWMVKEETTALWQPPTQDDDEDIRNGEVTTSTTSLWQPPTQNYEDVSTDAAPMPTTNESTTRKRLREEDILFSSDTRQREEEETFHTDASAAAADAFYSKLNRTLASRWQSRIYHMRNFNGWVKAMQIQQYYQSMNASNNKNKGIRILDLACGKGGDLTKWTLGKIQNYVGMDVARGSLQDAAQRARNLRHQLPRCTLTCADLGANVPGRYKNKNSKTMESLLTWSLHSESSSQADPVFTWQKGGGIALDETFDVVSIQFAIHYMMSSQKRAKRFFRTVSQLLTNGGKLLITTMDARVVVEHLLQTGCDFHSLRADDDPVTITLGDGLCRIQFAAPVLQRLFATNDAENKDADKNTDNWFGLEYSFTLLDNTSEEAQDDAVNLPEWLSPLPALEALAESVGLRLESIHNFHEFYQQNHDKPACQSSLYQMNVLNRRGSISATEWEISRLYCAMQFVKVKDYVENDDDDDDDDVDDTSKVKEEDNLDDIDPQLKAKLFPMALMKAKKGFDGEWNELDSEEKTRLTHVELRKLAT